jgi:hypothetical protein
LLLGITRDLTAGYAAGLWFFAALFFAGTIVLLELGIRWSRCWQATAARQAGVYAYRGSLAAVAEEPTA